MWHGQLQTSPKGAAKSVTSLTAATSGAQWVHQAERCSQLRLVQGCTHTLIMACLWLGWLCHVIMSYVMWLSMIFPQIIEFPLMHHGSKRMYMIDSLQPLTRYTVSVSCQYGWFGDYGTWSDWSKECSGMTFESGKLLIATVVKSRQIKSALLPISHI